jgi:tetratricopeptide (TPR) repeat protein
VGAYNEGDFAAAEQVLAQLVAKNPRDVEARKSLALALAAQGKNEAAIEQYSAILEIDGSDHVSLYRLALLERLAADAQSAVTHLERAVALNADDSYVDELARTYMQLGEYKRAADTWAPLIGTEGRTPESAVELLKLQAEALRLAGDAEGARGAVEQALDLAPDDSDLKALLESLGS